MFDTSEVIEDKSDKNEEENKENKPAVVGFVIFIYNHKCHSHFKLLLVNFFKLKGFEYMNKKICYDLPIRQFSVQVSLFKKLFFF